MYDILTSRDSELHKAVLTALGRAGYPQLASPFHSMLHELVVNSLKAVYKRLFYEHFIQEIGLDAPYEDWLAMFRTEIEIHNTENFARLARDHHVGVEVRIKLTPSHFYMLAANEGAPTDLEMNRINKSIETFRNVVEPTKYLEDIDEDRQKEGGGLGIFLIMMTLRNLGADARSFRIFSRWGKTYARIKVPVANLEKAKALI